MKRLAAFALLSLAAALAGCKPHGLHPHGAPPGQAKKMYRCGHCGVTKGGPGSCHGAALILIP